MTLGGSSDQRARLSSNALSSSASARARVCIELPDAAVTLKLLGGRQQRPTYLAGLVGVEVNGAALAHLPLAAVDVTHPDPVRAGEDLEVSQGLADLDLPHGAYVKAVPQVIVGCCIVRHSYLRSVGVFFCAPTFYAVTLGGL